MNAFLIGTTDVPVAEYETPAITDDETRYLLDLANTYLRQSLTRDDIVATYAGVRPLYDDGDDNPSAITRDYYIEARHPGRFTGRWRTAAKHLRRQDHHLPQAG